MRERPNTTNVGDAISSDSRPNDLYRSLERTFGHLLQSEDPDRYTLRRELYVSHEKMEQALLSYCSGATSAAAFLVGSTGIGKSTLIRHTLQVNRAPTLSQGTLIVPFSLNQRHIENNSDMRRQMAMVFQQAVWLAKGEPHEFAEHDIDAISGFLESSSPDLLNDPALDLTKSALARTKALSARPETAYQFSQVTLKLFAARNKSIDRIVLIIDDLEGKSVDLQNAAITNALETRACLLNTAAERQLPVRLLIALRPETHIWASQIEQVKTTEFRDITYSEPVSLFDIFKKRFDAVFNREDYSHIRDKSRLDQALSVLDAVGDALSTRFSARFVRLNNYNIRASLETFRLIVCNRRWLQRDPEWRPFFVIEEHNFAISQAAVMRAIGMGEGEIYPQRRTCLANLLYNMHEPASDLLLLYITKFLKLRNHDSATRDGLVTTFERLLGQSFDRHVFNELIDYGLSQGLIHNEISADGIRLTVTARAKELYAMLEDSTLLLELYRDDICQPLRNGRPARPTMTLSGAAERFAAVATLIMQFWNAEAQLRKLFASNGATEAGSSYFGSTFESARMRQGFRKSVDAFYSNKDDRPDDRPPIVQSAVVSLRGLAVPAELRMSGTN